MSTRTLGSWLSRAAAAALLAASLVTAATPASAGIGATAKEAGLGLAAGTCTVLYLPFKAAVSATGFFVGGMAWLVTGGERRPAFTIMERTAGGDWLVTQEHLQGERRFYVLADAQHTPVAKRD